MAWYLTDGGRLCKVTPSETEGFVQMLFIDPEGIMLVTGKFNLSNYTEITQEVADIIRGEANV